MKTKQYIQGLTFLFGSMALIACADSWDEHYGNNGKSASESAADAPTLLAHIEADEELRPFLRVVQHVGYDAVLSSSQTFTLWAPVITNDQADSVIAVYDAQKQLRDNNGNLRKDKDNTAITQFIQNHMALSGRSVNSETKDSVRMWNGKYMVLTANDINGVPFKQKNIVASNGIMYKLDGKQIFRPNVREAFALTEKLDSISYFFTLMDDYKLDPEESVRRDVIDGEIVYADSVIKLNNVLYSSLAYIQREDSNYLCLAPTNEVWEAEFAKYRPKFNFNNEVSDADSLELLNTRLAIIRGRFFNLKEQKNEYQDSIKNTLYVSTSQYWGLNVFMKPRVAWNSATNEGILGGLTPVECSNGLVYVDPDGRIDPSKTFLQTRYLRVSNRRNYELSLLTVGAGDKAEYKDQSEVDQKTVADEVEYGGVIHRFETLKDKSYIEVKPVSYTGVSENNDSQIYFYLRNTFANTYYNFYVVMVPAYANKSGYEDKDCVELRFQATYAERDDQPNSSTNPMPNAAYYKIRETRLKNLETGTNYFFYDGKDVSAICLGKGLGPFTYSTGGGLDCAVRLCINSAIQKTKFSKGEQTNVMRINRVIYVPFETKEEADAYELDLSNLKEYIEQ